MTKKSNSTNITKKEMKTMNKDLQKWLTQDTKDELSKIIKKKLENKKPKGMCKICGKKNAKSVCIKCGKSVCNSCFFNILSICEKCLSKETVEEWKTRKINWEKKLGVEWIE